jgi:hypothetical protein
MRELVVVVLSACLAGCQSGPSGPEGPSPPSSQPAPIPTEGPLSGRWVGPTAEGMGVINYSEIREDHHCAHTCVDYCKNFYDVVEATLSHQGTRVSGTTIWRDAGAECLSGGVFRRIPPSSDDNRSTHFLNMTVTPSGGVSVAWADAGGIGGDANFPVNHDLAGTYTASSITVSGERAETRGNTTETWAITFGLRRP